jgi:hypothetical protein
VAAEMEKESRSGNVLSKCFVTEVLPAPEGAVMIMILWEGEDMCKERKEYFMPQTTGSIL